jgi:molybdopterin-guanine dinucleotide biosynthesis protein A
VLAGGAARRLGGQDKPGLRVGGRALIQNVVAAGRDAGAQRVIVVGPSRTDVTDVLFVPDEQQGPVPALRRGLAVVSAPRIVLLAADLPFLRARHITGMLEISEQTGVRGAVLADDGGRAQWLAGCWHTAALADAIGRYQGESLRGLLAPLEPRLIQPEPGESPPWLDCDTPADVERARRLAARGDLLG